MQIFKVIIINLFILIFSSALITSCDNSSDPNDQPETKLTEQQAAALYAQNEFFIANLTGFLMADMVAGTAGNTDDLYDLGGVTTYGNSGLLKIGNLSQLLKNALTDTVYYRGDGCWVLNFLQSSESLSSDISGEVCFGSVDEMGYPLESNNLMDFLLNGSISTSYASDTFSETASFVIAKDLNMLGINGFNAGTGMITANGTHIEETIINFTSEEGVFNSTFKISFTVADFKIEPEAQYPAGGAYQFQMIIKASETGSEAVDFLINGNVTFDGSQYAGVSFNGYDFTLDMSNYN